MEENQRNIPEGWERKALIQLADYINGYGFKPDDWSKEGLPIIRIEQLKNPDAEYDYCNLKLPEKNIINPGDLIFSWSASLFLRIWDREQAALNQHLFKVVPFHGVNKIFLKYLLDSSIEELTKNAQGSTMQHITRKELHSFHAQFPKSLTEQRQIATILSKVDEAIAQTEALITKYSRIKTGLMQDLLTKGIDEHGNIRSEATHEFKDSPLGRIPVEWEVEKLNNLCLDIVDCPHNTPTYLEEGVLVARTMNIKNGVYDEANSSYVSEDEYLHRILRKEPKESDIIFTREAPVGEAFVIPKGMRICLGQRVMLLRVSENIKPEFLLELIYSDANKTIFDNMVSGTTNPHLNVKDVRELIFIKPYLKEQQRIMDLIIKQRSALHSFKSNLTKLQSLKTGLMQDLLSGKVRVNHLIQEMAESV